MKTNKLLLFLLAIGVSFCSYGQNPFKAMLNSPSTQAIIDADVPSRAQVFATDIIVQGSGCIGIDCVSSESFGFDTFRLKENNLRMHFDDTSSSASFPSNDWRFIFNDSANGGASYFAVEDATAGRQVFRVQAGAPVNSLYIDSAGDVGIGTSNAVVELHVADGDSPTLRLEQNGSSGFTPQTWDMAGNETNFFIRDVTNGSKLPFRIRPGAPDSAIDIAASGSVGIGTSSTVANSSMTLGTVNQAKGLVLNRMDTATRTGLTAAEGMLVYDTDLDQTFVGDGAGWLVAGGAQKVDAVFSNFTKKLILGVNGGATTEVDLSILANTAPLTGDDVAATRAQMTDLQNQVDDLMARMEAMESCGCYNDVTGDEGRAVVGDNANVAANQAYLSQNIPNPFDNTTNISYFVPFVNSNANIVISNATGQILENRSIDKFGQGSITVSKSRMSTGIYFYTLYADGKKIDTKRMVVE